MKKFTLSLIAFMFLFSGLNFGQGWEELTTGLEDDSDSWILYDMHFPEGQNDVGYAVSGLFTTGQQGKMIKTVDGGDTWDVIWPTTGTIKGLNVVWFTSVDVGFVGGYQQSTGTNYFIKTEDGGATWTEIDLGEDIWYFESIEFWDENNGVLATHDDRLFVTDDGFNTWTSATGITTGIFDVSYATADLLFLVGGDETMCKSEDGGLTWSEFYSGTFQRYFFGVDFANENFGVVGGEDGKILSTTNGGDSWSEYATGWHNFYPVVAFEADSAYVGGTDADIYKTTDAGANWEIEMEEDGSSLYRIQFTENNTAYTCGAWGKMWRKEAPLTAGFMASETTVCAGSSVDFTDLSTGTPNSWEWTFEGGDPATSTEQNPTVTYNSTGIFNVSLTVGDALSNEATTFEADYISVIETPAQADMPEGDDMICSDGDYTYTTTAVDFAEAYEWELLPAEAGTCTWNDNEANVETAEDWTGDFTLKVRATNMCGDGAWSDVFNGSIYLTPESFILQGGGGFCAGGDGVEITLSGSQNDINYELYHEGDPTGNIVAGTGSSISFGLITEVGYYSAEGSNDNCSAVMQEQIEVFNFYPPLEPGTPTGPNAVCNDETSDYESTGSDDADSYEWILEPEEAGTLTADGLTATVEWSTDFTGMAALSLYGINDCGDGYPSEALEVAVEGMPTPEVEGLDMVCDFDVTDYTTVENEGSTYTWEVTGGTISDGQGTYMVTIEWGEAGNGTVTVTEETGAGCQGVSEAFEVFIDDCTDISEMGSISGFAVYPNPAKDILNIEFSINSGMEHQVSIYNHLGQQVHQSDQISATGQQKLELNIAHLSKGIYFIKVSNGNETVVTKKLIKK